MPNSQAPTVPVLPLGAKAIPLVRSSSAHGRGKDIVIAYALVSEADYDRLAVHRWGLLRDDHTCYARRYNYDPESGKVTAILMHREVLGLEPGDRRLVADHVNFEGLDNRRENLRAVTYSENNKHVRPKADRQQGVA